MLLAACQGTRHSTGALQGCSNLILNARQPFFVFSKISDILPGSDSLHEGS